MKRLVTHSVGLLVLIAVAAATFGVVVNSATWRSDNRDRSVTLRSVGPNVTQLERIGELTTCRIHITDVLWAEGEGHRGSWLIKGDAILACDMSKTRIERVDFERRTAMLRLPSPRVVSARVDHDKTKTWSVEKTSWLPWKWGDEGAIRDAAMSHAQRLVETGAASVQHVDSAKSQAESLIRQMYDFVDWKVVIVWD